MKYIISVDIGTTSVKTGLFNEKLESAGYVSEEYQLITPENGHVEMEPEVYWETVANTIKKLLDKYRVKGDLIEAVALCAQGETIIPVNARGVALHNALVWFDARATDEAESIKEKISEQAYYHTTGLNEIWAANPICKLQWFKNNRKKVYEETYKFLLLTDYIGFRLCGEMVAEWTMMSSTGYYDIVNHSVWEEGLKAAGIDKEKIPDVKKSGVIVGTMLPDIAEELGISEDVKVIISANDQMCGAVGGGNIDAGTITETTGTALVLTATVDRPDYDIEPKIIYYLHVNGKYLIVPYNNTAGIILKWFKDEFCELETKKANELDISVYELLGDLADKAEPLSQGLMLYPQFAGKVSPNNNPKAKGAFLNVDLSAKKQHFIRAIFEGVAYMLNENIKAIENCGIKIDEIRSLGGGSKSDVWNQIKADIINKPIVTLECGEATSLGVAIIAAASLGWVDDIETGCKQGVRIKKTFYPKPDNVQVYTKGFENYLKLDNELEKMFNSGE